MRKVLLVSCLAVLATATAFFVGTSAFGKSANASNPFKGSWPILLDTPFGQIEVTAVLTPNGKGKLWLPNHARLPVVHQETDTWISWTIELPAVQAPDGNAHTIIGRGTLGESGDMSGNLVIVTAIQDDSSPVGYQTHVGTFSAPKRGK